MTALTRLLPKQQTQTSARPGTWDAEARTIELSWGRGAPVLRHPFLDDPYTEQLDMAGADLSRLNAGAPLLNSHDDWTLTDIIGVVERAWIEAGEGRAVVRFSEREDVAGIVADVAAGIIRNVSVGYSVEEYHVVERDGAPDTYTAVRWTPLELSLVPIPADPSAQVRAAPQTFPAVITRAEQAPTHEAIAMTDETVVTTAAAPAEQQTADHSAIRAEGARAERERQAGIRRCAQATRADAETMERFIADGTPLEQARAAMIDAAASRDETTRINGAHATTTADSAERFRTGVERAILARAGMLPAAERAAEAGSEFRGMTLLEIARASLSRAGASATGDKLTVVGRAFTHTTGDFSNLLASTANKAMLKGWMEAPETFGAWTSTGSLPDFKPTSRVDIGAFPALALVPEGAEYTYATLSDRGETAQIATYGKLFSITRQAIINDDLNAFTRIPASMARAARRTVGNLVYAILTGNPTMGDSVALFHANHSNLDTGGGSALSVTSLAAARVKMAKQTGQQAEPLNIQPAHLIVPVALRDTAAVILASEYNPDATNKLQAPNPVRGMVDVIADPRLDANSATAWYLTASPTAFDAIEVLYLDGNDAPFLDQQAGWNVDGTEFKVRIDAGVKAWDYRTLYKSAGA